LFIDSATDWIGPENAILFNRGIGLFA